MSSMNVITQTQFIAKKKQQQIKLWQQSIIQTHQLVDWILTYDTDRDVESLCEHFDPVDTIAKY